MTIRRQFPGWGEADFKAPAALNALEFRRRCGGVTTRVNSRVMGMNRSFLACFLLAAAVPTSAHAQFAGMPDVIAQTIAGMNAPLPDKCYDGRWTPSAESIAKGPARVEAAMANYRQVAATGTDLRKVIGSEGVRRWQLDGKVQDVRAVRDPFLSRVARLELLAVTPSNGGAYYRAQWRAIAADGSEVGSYDALMFWRSKKFMSLDLYTPSATDRPLPDTPFCQRPGDVEEWKEARAKLEAEKAAKRAAKDAGKANGGN